MAQQLSHFQTVIPPASAAEGGLALLLPQRGRATHRRLPPSPVPAPKAPPGRRGAGRSAGAGGAHKPRGESTPAMRSPALRIWEERRGLLRPFAPETVTFHASQARGGPTPSRKQMT